MNECTCDPCTYRHGWEGGADCCMGTGIVYFDYDCPVSDHAEWAIKQHGPRNQQEETT